MATDDDLSPRKLPRQLRARATVEAIFEAAMQTLDKAEEKGEPSVQAIADRAGVSVGSLYQYFPTKGALVNALIGFHLKGRMEALLADLEKAKGLKGEDAARMLVGNFVDSMRPRLGIERAMARAFVRVGSLESLTAYDAEMIAGVKRFLDALGAEVRPVDTEIAAFLVSNTLRTAVLLTMLQKPERLSDPAFREELITLVTRYLKP
jgi:AcrR family transcriptional regulator